MRMMRFTGVVFSLIYVFTAWTGSVAGTCTMGDDGPFVASVFYSVPIFLLAGGCLWWTRKIDGCTLGLLLIPAVSGIISVSIWIPILWNTTFLGNHLCGEEFNSYLTGSYLVERSVPTLHAAFASILLMLSKPMINQRIWRKKCLTSR